VILRGLLASMVLAFFAGLLSGVILLLIRLSGGLTAGDSWREAGMLLASAVLTGVVGPLVFRMCRSIDARFARTAREREITLGGLV